MTLDAILRRISTVELLGFGAVTAAIETGLRPNEAITTYRDSIRALLAVRADLHARMVEEGRLIPVDVMRRTIAEHDAALTNRLRTMPRQLAHLLTPDDPRRAERVLSDWLTNLLRGQS